MRKTYETGVLPKEQMEKYIKLLKQMEVEEEDEKPHRIIARKIYEELLVKEKSRS